MPQALGERAGQFVYFGPCLSGARELPQDGVDHSGRVRLSGGAAELDAFIQCCVRRNPIHMQELESTYTQCDRHRHSKLLSGPRQQGTGLRIQRDLPTQNPHHQRRCQIAVFR